MRGARRPIVDLPVRVYDDKAAFDAHLATAHFKEFNDKTAPWIAEKKVRILERVAPGTAGQ